MITYGSTTLTSYNTITKIEVYYYKSTSSTSLAGGSWSTTKPTWENGKYIWQKIRTTYEGKLENGLYYSESDPVNITGQQGQTGTAAYSYKLNASDTSITVSKDGTYSKTKVTFSATYKQGTGAVNPYKGRFKIETTTNGTTWTTQDTSSVNESSKEYTIPTGILNIRCSLYQADGTSVLLDIVSVAIVTDGKDGTNGTNGLNNARVILYRRFSAAPSGTDIAPTGNVTYTFSTGVAANNLNSWTQNIPTGTDPVYMIAASASNTGATDTIAKTEWSTPIKILENGQNGTNGTNGTNGIDGYNQATIYLYQRKSGTAPAKPTSAVTYTFSTGALSSTPSGWSRTIPANDGNPCYVTTATAIAKTATYSIAASAWSAVVVLSENGTSITITSTTVKYQKGTSGTTKPTGTWGTSIPSIGENEFLWTQTIVNYSDGSKTEAYSVSRNAKNGTNGTSPTVSSTVVEYQQSTGGTTPPIGTWSTTAPSATAGQYMWTKTTITYSDGKTAVSYSVSKNGANGINGTDGTSQNLLLDVYVTSLDNVKAPWERYLSDASNTTITGQFIAEDNLPDPNATHFYRITDSSASTKSRGLCFYNGGTPPFLDGHTYRIGCWVRNHAGSPSISFYLGTIGSWTNRIIITNTNWEWVECVHTFGDVDPAITAHGSTYKRLYFYFGNNNVEGSSLDMCGFKVEEVQTDISTARNYLLKTEKLEGWGVTGGTTISNGIVTFPEVTSNTWRESYPTKNFKYEIIRNKNIIFSVRVKADVGKMCACNLCIGVDSTETAYTRQKYANNYVYFTGTGEWQTICIAIPISDGIFTSGSGTPNYDNCWVTVRVSAVNIYHNSFQATQPQLSLGTTATAWSAAPEDVEASMQEKVDNIEIGGRNLLLNTGGNDAIKVTTISSPKSQIYNINYSMENGEIHFTSVATTAERYYRFVAPTKENLWGIEPGETYTISFYTKGTIDANDNVGYRSQYTIGTGNWLTISDNRFKEKVGSDYQKVFFTETIPSNASSYFFSIQIYGSNASDFYIKNLKFEKGNKSTDWTPAPEDVEESIKAYAESIQSQVDGMAEIHYGTAVPTLSNAPYTSWKDTATRDMHVDDLYYNTSTGYCYRFTKSGSTYSWSRIKDSDITAAATAAGNAQTTANNANTLAGQKRRIFVSQPTPPYEVGDLWVEGSNGDIKKCKTARASGSYTASDWELASKYTDDTLASEANDKIDNLEIGGRNLLLKSDREISNANYNIITYDLSDKGQELQEGDIVTFSMKARILSERKRWAIYNSGSSLNISDWQAITPDGNSDVIYTWTGEWKVNHNGSPVANTKLYVYLGTGNGTENNTIYWAKLERGNKVTDWTPAPEDTDASIQQVQDNLDNLEIGGRNLLKNSKALTDNWRLDQATVSDGVVTVTPTTNRDRRMYQMPAAGYWAWTIGQEYTVSVAARSDNGASFVFQANGAGRGSKSIVTDSTWKRYSLTFVASQAGTGSMAFSIVETSDKTIQFKEPKLEYGAKATDWTPAPEDTQADIDTALAQSVEYIIGTQTAATGNWTGVSSSLTELKDGTQIRYWLPYAGSGNASLNLTLKDGTATGAIPIYRQGGSASSAGVVTANRVTTHFPAGTSISMVYGVNRVVSAVYSGTTYTGTFTGWFADGAYDSGNTYNRIRMQNAITATTAITAGRIICGTSSGYKNIGANIAFDLSYPLLYAASAITATKTGDNNYLQINGISASNNGTITSGGANKTLYLKGTVSGNTFTISASPFMTTVIPTSADGFYYIPLGMMYSATAIYFISSNRLYAYIDGAFQPVDTAAVLRAQDAKNLATAVYGTCSTAAGTAAKSVACNNFVLFNGARIQITFTYANTASVPTLNVNNTGAKSIYINKSVVSASNQLLWGAGSKMEFVYDGTGWILQNAPFSLYGTCSTASATANKEVTCNEAVICKASVIYVKMTYSTTAASAKLNVASTGAKDIKANGANLTANSRFNWNAGATIAFTFDGQYWNMSDDTITAYVTDTSDDGIMVHPVNDQNTGWSIGNSIQLLKNSISYIKLWLENNIAKIRIGEENKGHIIIDNDSVDVMNNNTCLASFGVTSTIGQTDGAHIEQNSSGLQVIDTDGNNQVTFGAQSAVTTWENSTATIPPSTEENNIVQIELPTELASDQDMTLTIDTTVYTIPTMQTYSYTHTDYTISYDGTYIITITNLSTSTLNSTLDYPVTQPLNYGITATTPNATRIKARTYANNTIIAEGGIYANDAGNFGLFDSKRSSWMIMSDINGNVRIPSLTPKIISTTKVTAPATKGSWAYANIQLKQWAVIAVRVSVHNVRQYILFFSTTTGSIQNIMDSPSSTLYVRGQFMAKWDTNRIYVNWVNGNTNVYQTVFFDQVIGLIRK